MQMSFLPIRTVTEKEDDESEKEKDEEEEWSDITDPTKVGRSIPSADTSIEQTGASIDFTSLIQNGRCRSKLIRDIITNTIGETNLRIHGENLRE